MALDPIRRNGPFAPLASDYYHDDDLAEAGEAAELLYVRGLAYCANKPTDGYISDKQVRRFVGVGMDNLDERIEALVEQGLWEPAEGGYQIRSWLKWNKSADEIGWYRARDRGRKRSPAASSPAPEGDSEAATDTDGSSDVDADGGARTSERNPSGIRAEESDVPSGLRAEGDSTSDPQSNTQHVTTQHVTTPSARRADGTSSSDESANGLFDAKASPTQSRSRSPSAQSRQPPADPPGYTFDDFWALCPRKEAKGAARKAWQAARKKTDAEKIIAGMRRYRDVSRSREPKYIAHPATWLNQERWDDDPVAHAPDKRRDDGRSVSNSQGLAGWEASYAASA